MAGGAAVADDRVMASILIRCTGATDIPADAPADRLEPRVARIADEVRVSALRRARVERVDEFSGRPAGRLVALDVAGGQAAPAAVFLAEILGDTGLLGRRPTDFVPHRSATAPPPDVEAGWYATAVRRASA